MDVYKIMLEKTTVLFALGFSLSLSTSHSFSQFFVWASFMPEMMILRFATTHSSSPLLFLHQLKHLSTEALNITIPNCISVYIFESFIEVFAHANDFVQLLPINVTIYVWCMELGKRITIIFFSLLLLLAMLMIFGL